jgi:hypothetical protein
MLQVRFDELSDKIHENKKKTLCIIECRFVCVAFTGFQKIKFYENIKVCVHNLTLKYDSAPYFYR